MPPNHAHIADRKEAVGHAIGDSSTVIRYHSLH